MRCEEAMREFSAETPSWTALRVRRHLQSCAACAQEIMDIRRLETSVREWRADAAPAHLQGRIAAAVAASEHRNDGKINDRFKRIPKENTAPIKLLYAAGLAALGGLYFGFHQKPAVADAEIVRRMTAAAETVRSAHVIWRMTDYKTDNDTVSHHTALAQVEEDWYQNGRTRKEGVWGSRLIVGAIDAATDARGKKYLRTPGTYYRYDARAGKVSAIPEMGLQYSHFSLADFVGDLASRDPNSMETLGYTRIHGQAAREISIAVSRPTTAVNYVPVPGDERKLCWVTVETNLPARIADQRYESGVWRTTSRIDCDFDAPWDPALFDPATLGR